MLAIQLLAIEVGATTKAGPSGRRLVRHPLAAHWPDAAASYDRYGFAVDYRGVHPIVYSSSAARSCTSSRAPTRGPMHPMLWGNPTDTPHGAFDDAMHFEPSSFAQDPEAALRAYGVDTTEFRAGWAEEIRRS